MATTVQQIHPVAHLPLVLGVLRRLGVAGRVPIFPVRLRAELDVKRPYVSRGSTAPPCSTSARAIWPLHWHDTRKCLRLSS